MSTKPDSHSFTRDILSLNLIPVTVPYVFGVELKLEKTSSKLQSKYVDFV